MNKSKKLALLITSFLLLSCGPSQVSNQNVKIDLEKSQPNVQIVNNIVIPTTIPQTTNNPSTMPVTKTSQPTAVVSSTPIATQIQTQLPAPTPNPTVIVTSTPNTANIEKIVFVSNRDGNDEIYIMNADGTNQKRLTNTSYDEGNPSLSPDGKKVVFPRVINGKGSLFTINSDGSNEISLTDGASQPSLGDFAPNWSPDGTKIVYHSRISGSAQIHKINMDGTGKTKLTSVGENYLPKWSPDGSKIVFASTRDNSSQIYLMNSDGSNQKWFVTGLSPSWSPDGTKILYAFNNGIYIANDDGTSPNRITNLSNNAGSDRYQKWLPSNKIIFCSTRLGNWQIYSMNPDGLNQVKLSNNQANERFETYD